MLSAVVQLGIRVALNLDNNGLLVRGHLEGTLRLGDSVVIRIGALVQCIGKRVGGCARVGLGAGDAVRCALALDEAVAGDGDLIIGQSRAIVGLGSIGRRQGDGTLGDFQLAIFGGNGKLSGHVVASGVSHLGGAGNSVDVRANVRSLDLSGQAGNGVLDTVDLELVSHKTGGGVLRAVVGGSDRVSLDRDLVLRATVGDGERARVLRQVVVLFEIRTSHRRDGLDSALT